MRILIFAIYLQLFDLFAIICTYFTGCSQKQQLFVIQLLQLFDLFAIICTYLTII